MTNNNNNNNNNNNKTSTIFIIYGAKPYVRVHSGPLSGSRSAPGGTFIATQVRELWAAVVTAGVVAPTGFTTTGTRETLAISPDSVNDLELLVSLIEA